MVDEQPWGPAMAALTDLQRKYVLAMAVNPFATPTEWAMSAGYSQHSAGSRKAGHDCKRNPKIEAAVFEVAQSLLYTEGPMLAAAGLLLIARDQKHPKHMRALETLANRVGLHETSEHTVKVEHVDRTGVAMLDRIKALSAKLGIDPATLLGGNVISRGTLPAPIDAEFEVLEDGHDRPEHAVVLSQERLADAAGTSGAADGSRQES